MKEQILKWIQLGHTTLPNILLDSYKYLNISEVELVLIIQVFSSLEKGHDFPTPNELADRMTISDGQCLDILRRLMQKGLIEIKDSLSSDGIRVEKYSLEPLWSKLFDYLVKKTKEEERHSQKSEEIDLYTCFEQEFGRPLSPFECETLTLWVDDDQHEPSIIKAALRESVISGKLNFRYIDRILFEWKKNGIKTVEQARNYGKRFRSSHQQPTKTKQVDALPTSNSDNSPFYNWLDQ